MEHSPKLPLHPVSGSQQNSAMAPTPKSHSKIPTQPSSPLKEVRATLCTTALSASTQHANASSSLEKTHRSRIPSYKLSPSKTSTNLVTPKKFPTSRPSSPVTVVKTMMSGRPSSALSKSTTLTKNETNRPTTPLKFELQHIDGSLDQNGHFTPITPPTPGSTHGGKTGSVKMGRNVVSPTPTKKQTVHDGSMLGGMPLSPSKSSPIKSVAWLGGDVPKQTSTHTRRTSSISTTTSSPSNRLTRIPTITSRSTFVTSSDPVERPRAPIRTSTTIPPPSFDLPIPPKTTTPPDTIMTSHGRKTSDGNTPSRSIVLPGNLLHKTISLAKVDMGPQRRPTRTNSITNTPTTHTKSRVPVPSSTKYISSTPLPKSARKPIYGATPRIPSIFSTPLTTKPPTKPPTPAPINSLLYKPILHPRSPFGSEVDEITKAYEPNNTTTAPTRAQKRKTQSSHISEIKDMKAWEGRIANAQYVSEMVHGWNNVDIQHRNMASSEPEVISPTTTTTSSPTTPTPPPNNSPSPSHTPPNPQPLHFLRVPTTHACLPETPPSKKVARGKVGAKRDVVHTPSRITATALDRAIDRHIEEEVCEGRDFTQSGQRLSDLLERRGGGAGIGVVGV
ncbi:hypothetical protein P280DRAFT_524072 [Massarina eburnea CBS 473.64]|uniref:Uncharacterized protein n=1 Tax=Massarina eburnea CBS 473.64 TaxID=1395130 RepID=A0A6A6RG81_9PLEO|nr:hypothetical protein P280DRAFT_524072 [Massarina eburnea CBS 473.64]